MPTRRLHNFGRDATKCGANSTEFGWNSARFGSISANLWRQWSTFVQTRSDSAQFGHFRPSVTTLGQLSTKICRARLKFGLIRPQIQRKSANETDIAPHMVASRPNLTNRRMNISQLLHASSGPHLLTTPSAPQLLPRPHCRRSLASRSRMSVPAMAPLSTLSPPSVAGDVQALWPSSELACASQEMFIHKLLQDGESMNAARLRNVLSWQSCR